MTPGPAEAREASSSTTSFRHRSPSISASSLPSGSSPPSHRQSKRSLSNAAAAAAVHHATNGSACGADGTSGSGPSTEAALSMSGALVSSPSPSSSSLGLQAKPGMDGHQRSPALDSIAESQIQASGSGSSHSFASATLSSSRRASGSCHPSSSYDGADGHIQHHGRLQLHLPPRPQPEEEQEVVANYHTSSPSSENRLPLPDLADYHHSMASHSRAPTSAQRRPEIITAETYGEPLR